MKTCVVSWPVVLVVMSAGGEVHAGGIVKVIAGTGRDLKKLIREGNVGKAKAYAVRSVHLLNRIIASFEGGMVDQVQLRELRRQLEQVASASDLASQQDAALAFAEVGRAFASRQFGPLSDREQDRPFRELLQAFDGQ